MHRPPHFPAMGQPNSHAHNPFDAAGQINHQSPAIGGPGPTHGQQFHPAQTYNHSNSVSPSPLTQMPSPSTIPQHMASAQGMSAGQSKRPYRQRRKDPSCDACRERKVKVHNHWLRLVSKLLTLHSVTLRKQLAVTNVNLEA
jgi:hypothetical protein